MTKKFLIAFSDQGLRKTRKNEFLVPNPNQLDNLFIGIETGKICQYGLVVYTGEELDPNIIVRKLIENKIISKTNSSIDNILTEYLQFIKGCKIADVIEIKHESGKYIYSVTGLRMKSEISKIP